jgi:hypothetical protein
MKRLLKIAKKKTSAPRIGILFSIAAQRLPEEDSLPVGVK